jgi:hypothetical protein
MPLLGMLPRGPEILAIINVLLTSLAVPDSRIVRQLKHVPPLQAPEGERDAVFYRRPVKESPPGRVEDRAQFGQTSQELPAAAVTAVEAVQLALNPQELGLIPGSLIAPLFKPVGVHEPGRGVVGRD